MAPKRMPIRQQRMVKIVRRLVGHSDPFHHATRARIFRYRERYDFRKPEYFEAERKHGSTSLRSVSVAPVLRAEAPSNLHTGGEVGFEARYQETDEPCECCGLTNFHGPKTEAILVEVGLYTRNKSVAFRL